MSSWNSFSSLPAVAQGKLFLSCIPKWAGFLQRQPSKKDLLHALTSKGLLSKTEKNPHKQKLTKQRIGNKYFLLGFAFNIFKLASSST